MARGISIMFSGVQCAKELLICWRKFGTYAFIKTGNILSLYGKFREKMELLKCFNYSLMEIELLCMAVDNRGGKMQATKKFKLSQLENQ